MSKAIGWIFASVAAIFIAPACAMLSAMVAVGKSVFLVFVLAALGCWLGLAVSPLVGIMGAGTGACLGSVLDENVDLRSGDLQGSGARDKEIDRLKSMVILKDGEFRIKATEVGEAVLGKDWAVTWIKRLALTLGIMLLMFFMARGRYLKKVATGEKVESRFWMLIHAIFGWNWTRVKAFGYDPMAEVLTKGKVDAPHP